MISTKSVQFQSETVRNMALMRIMLVMIKGTYSICLLKTPRIISNPHNQNEFYQQDSILLDPNKKVEPKSKVDETSSTHWPSKDFSY